jgi:hypothetical protein
MLCLYTCWTCFVKLIRKTCMEKFCVLFREPNYMDLKSTLKLFQYILPVFGLLGWVAIFLSTLLQPVPSRPIRQALLHYNNLMKSASDYNLNSLIVLSWGLFQYNKSANPNVMSILEWKNGLFPLHSLLNDSFSTLFFILCTCSEHARCIGSGLFIVLASSIDSNKNMSFFLWIELLVTLTRQCDIHKRVCTLNIHNKMHTSHNIEKYNVWTKPLFVRQNKKQPKRVGGSTEDCGAIHAQ